MDCCNKGDSLLLLHLGWSNWADDLRDTHEYDSPMFQASVNRKFGLLEGPSHQGVRNGEGIGN